jgi:hypothetical protein
MKWWSLGVLFLSFLASASSELGYDAVPLTHGIVEGVFAPLQITYRYTQVAARFVQHNWTDSALVAFEESRDAFGCSMGIRVLQVDRRSPLSVRQLTSFSPPSGYACLEGPVLSFSKNGDRLGLLIHAIAVQPSPYVVKHVRLFYESDTLGREWRGPTVFPSPIDGVVAHALVPSFVGQGWTIVWLSPSVVFEDVELTPTKNSLLTLVPHVEYKSDVHWPNFPFALLRDGNRTILQLATSLVEPALGMRWGRMIGRRERNYFSPSPFVYPPRYTLYDMAYQPCDLAVHAICRFYPNASATLRHGLGQLRVANDPHTGFVVFVGSAADGPFTWPSILVGAQSCSTLDVYPGCDSNVTLRECDPNPIVRRAECQRVPLGLETALVRVADGWTQDPNSSAAFLVHTNTAEPAVALGLAINSGSKLAVVYEVLLASTPDAFLVSLRVAGFDLMQRPIRRLGEVELWRYNARQQAHSHGAFSGDGIQIEADGSDFILVFSQVNSAHLANMTDAPITPHSVPYVDETRDRSRVVFARITGF